MYASLPDLGQADRADIDRVFRAYIDRVLRDYLDEHFEIRLPAYYPEGGQAFRGRDGAARFAATLQEAWGESRFEPERFLDAGDQVVVLVRFVAKGGASGVPIEVRTAHVWTVRAGRATSISFYRDRSEALEAVGLRE